MTANDFVLSLRTAPRAGPQRNMVFEEVRPLGGCIWVIFIHGFNVDRARGLEQGETLWGNLSRGEPEGRVLKGVFLWPSDLYGSRTLSKVAYPKMVEPARRAGRILGTYLAERNQMDAVLVGHSLGALVALTAADWLRGKGQLRGFALLGAAVDVGEMEVGGAYSIAPLADREAVEYCPDDKVLRSAFRVGQRAAAPFVPVVGAVGLTGQPWSRGWRYNNCRFDHHTHWKEPGSADAVAWAMNHSVSGREPPVNNVAENTSPEWELK